MAPGNLIDGYEQWGGDHDPAYWCGVKVDRSAHTGPSADRSTRSTVLRYALAGGVVYAVDITSLWVLHSKANLPLALATTLAFGCAFVANLTINRSFTFASSGHVGKQAVRLLVLVGLNYVSTLAIVVGLSHVWGNYLASKTIATAANAVFNFFAYRNWVFAVREEVEHGEEPAAPTPHPDPDSDSDSDFGRVVVPVD
jgi:putative flippase GtrA